MAKQIQLKTLTNDIKQCQLCYEDVGFSPRPVIQIHPKAKILIAGQAPGRKVNASGIPFQDASGDRLRQWMGIDRDDFFNSQKVAIVPMAFCYPGTYQGSKKSGDKPPPKRCADTWRTKILDQLTNIELTLVVGQYAKDWHLPELKKLNLTEAIKHQLAQDSSTLLLPHPSPRNNIWLKKNHWLEDNALETLKTEVKRLLPK